MRKALSLLTILLFACNVIYTFYATISAHESLSIRHYLALAGALSCIAAYIYRYEFGVKFSFWILLIGVFNLLHSTKSELSFSFNIGIGKASGGIHLQLFFVALLILHLVLNYKILKPMFSKIATFVNNQAKDFVRTIAGEK